MKIAENAPIQTVTEKKTVCSIPAEEVARVKGLGCLWDKRTENAFNVRVITVNGKLSSEKLAAIAVIARLGLSVARTESYIETLLAGKERKPEKIDLGAFLNNLSHTLQKIQSSGIPAVSERRETDRQIVLTITIPK